MRVGLFTKNFLEPTHVAIAQVLRSLPDIQFDVFTKDYAAIPGFALDNTRLAALLPFETNLERLAEGCDIIHAIYDGAVAFRAFETARALGKPFVLSFHGGYDTNAKIRKANLKGWTRLICEAADLVTVVGPSDAARLAEIGVGRPVQVMPVPVDFSVLPQCGGPDSGAAIMAIGRLIPKKGFHKAVAALALLPPEFRIEIVGDGPDKEALIDLAHSLGVADRVSFPGYLTLTETLSRLASAQLLLHPALRAVDGNAEGTPQVILWAQAMGVPVISGATGSICDIVRDKLSGLLVDTESPAEISSAILRLRGDPGLANVLRKGGRVQAVAHGLGELSERWRRLYSELGPRSVGTVGVTRPTAVEELPDLLAEAGERCGAPGTLFRFFDLGGQGNIYVACPEGSDPLAVKIPVCDDSDGPDGRRVARGALLREGRIMQALTARGCDWAPCFKYADPAGRFLVREFIPGRSLHESIQACSVAERVVLLEPLMATAKAAFVVLHGEPPEPYVFRDWKPRNLIVQRGANGPSVRVFDAGSIRSTAHRPPANRKGPCFGTRNWLHWSPEMLTSGGKNFSIPSDYFALGVCIYQLLIGHPPYNNLETREALVLQAYQAELGRVAARWMESAEELGLDEEFSNWVIRCLDPVAEVRPLCFTERGGVLMKARV